MRISDAKQLLETCGGQLFNCCLGDNAYITFYKGSNYSVEGSADL